ncbi:MAG: FAD/NAD(P)-binding protein [Pseudomonadota bacterium]|jgi:Uncharacterized protein conserved in bacteria
MSFRTILIVGGGFTGTVLAARLLRESHAQPTCIILVERQEEVGRGLAYAKHDFPYLLNVPAGQMSADPENPTEFLEFAQQQGVSATADDFLPRRLYGEYLSAKLKAAARNPSPGTQFLRIHGEVVRIRRVSQSGKSSWSVGLGDGRSLSADTVVLALGNPPPRKLHRCELDPWRAAEEVQPGQSVLLVGTGLTMVDVALRLSTVPGVALTAISRHGLLPRAQTAFTRRTMCDGGELLDSPVSLLALVSRVREQARAAVAAGRDWREVVTQVRACAPALWRRMSLEDRSRFLRHVRAYWDVHRHRLPAETAARIAQLEAEGKLQVHAGRIREIRRVDRGPCVIWYRRGALQSEILRVDHVVNCTGPDYRVRQSPEPLIRSLLRAGLIRPDPLELGIEVDPSGEVIDARGRPVPRLYYVGPMLRARDWEATAVPELRRHVAALARRLTAEATVKLPKRSPALAALGFEIDRPR